MFVCLLIDTASCPGSGNDSGQWAEAAHPQELLSLEAKDRRKVFQ